MKRDGKRGKLLAQRIKTYGEQEVHEAMRFVCEAHHHQAKFIRRKVGDPFETTMRYIESYASSWREHGAVAENHSFAPDSRPIVGVTDTPRPPTPDGDVPL